MILHTRIKYGGGGGGGEREREREKTLVYMCSYLVLCSSDMIDTVLACEGS